MRCHALCWPLSPAAMMDHVSAVCAWAQPPRPDAVIALGKLSERMAADGAPRSPEAATVTSSTVPEATPFHAMQTGPRQRLQGEALQRWVPPPSKSRLSVRASRDAYSSG